MKKIYYLLFFGVLFIAAYFITEALYPKYSPYFPFFGVLFVIDFYLWFSIHNRISQFHKILAYSITFIYWLPLTLLMLMTVISFFVSTDTWSIAWRTYPMAFVFVIYTSKLFAIAFLILADIIMVIRHAIRFARQKKHKIKDLPVKKPITRAKFIQNIGLLGGGIILSGLIIGMVRWAYDFRIRQVRVYIPDIPEGLEGLRIVQISDLHLGSWTSYSAMEEAVEKINNLDPDLVLFTGDLVNFSTKEAYKFENLLSKIKAKYGVFAVLGNHDYGDYVNWSSTEEKENNLQDLIDFYQRISWKLLRNENIITNINDNKIAILGVDNWSTNERFPRYGNIDEAIINLQNIPVKLLLSHDPSHWEAEIMGKHPDIDVTFSGHTHGFQFGLEMKNFKWSPAQYMYRFWAGLYRFQKNGKPQYLYVNRGLGNIGYPGRIGILPEITFLTLTGVKEIQG